MELKLAEYGKGWNFTISEGSELCDFLVRVQNAIAHENPGATVSEHLHVTMQYD